MLIINGIITIRLISSQNGKIHSTWVGKLTGKISLGISLQDDQLVIVQTKRQRDFDGQLLAVQRCGEGGELPDPADSIVGRLIEDGVA